VTSAESLVISAHGVLLESPVPLYTGATIVLFNRKRSTNVSAWVIRSVPGDRPDRFHLAIEFLGTAPGFWGPDYSP
jgi:hypothetical protein